jgi:hypothetical protein
MGQLNKYCRVNLARIDSLISQQTASSPSSSSRSSPCLLIIDEESPDSSIS